MASREKQLASAPVAWHRWPGLHEVRAGVKALVTSTERVLLIRERHSDGSTFWTLPGGGLWPDERPADAVRRELAEELRCRTLVGDSLTTFWYYHQSAPVVTWYEVFDCSLVTPPTAVLTEGVIEFRWVDPTAPPPETLPQVRRLLERAAGI
jgi:8-oxo-dGTP diphosphatase